MKPFFTANIVRDGTALIRQRIPLQNNVMSSMNGLQKKTQIMVTPSPAPADLNNAIVSRLTSSEDSNLLHTDKEKNYVSLIDSLQFTFII